MQVVSLKDELDVRGSRWAFTWATAESLRPFQTLQQTFGLDLKGKYIWRNLPDAF